jgi:hypothetical protein
MRHGSALRSIVGLFVLAVAVFVGSCSASSPSPPASQAPQPSAQPGDVISWSEAAASVGQTITVEGPVTQVSKGLGPHGPALLVYVGADPSDPQRFVAVIPTKVLKQLSVDQREQLSGALVRVTGTIVSYRGAATIVVKSARQLRIQQ